LAIGEIFDGYVEASVLPMLISKTALLATVNDVYNAVMVTGNVTDNTLFYGRGAGKLPAAGAVVSDIVEAARHLHVHITHEWSHEIMPVASFSESIYARQVRVEFTNEKNARCAIESVFGNVEWVSCGLEIDQLVFIAPPMKERDFEEKKKILLNEFTDIHFHNALRIYADR
jgi:homoserine dehydrogenase